MENGTLGRLEETVMCVILQLQDQAYGVAIREKIADLMETEYSFGAIYTTLERLEKKGFVSSRIGESTAARGGRAKKYFEVTSSGQAALHRTARVTQALRPASGTAGA
jgi:PadR family transcriptional regulator PadR